MNKIFQKLLLFQSEVRVVQKDKTGYGYKYASLDNIISTIAEPLKNSGLAYYHNIENDNMVCYLIDTDSGESITSQAPMQIINFKGMNEVQALGAVMTYLRRYTLTAILGLVTDDDTDGKTNTPEVKKEASKPQFLLNEVQAKQIQTALDGGRSINDIVDGIKKKFILTKDIEEKIFSKYSLVEIEEIQELAEEINL